jgi:hypothetical protein
MSAFALERLCVNDDISVLRVVIRTFLALIFSDDSLNCQLSLSYVCFKSSLCFSSWVLCCSNSSKSLVYLTNVVSHELILSL